MGSFIACSPIERRHARQRVAEEPSGQVPRLKFGSAITIRQRQWTRPNGRREYVSEQTRDRDQFHPGFWPLSFPPCGFPNTPRPQGTPTPWPKSDGRLSELGLNAGICWKNRVMVTDASVRRKHKDLT